MRRGIEGDWVVSMVGGWRYMDVKVVEISYLCDKRNGIQRMNGQTEGTGQGWWEARGGKGWP
jgi:hypothetical protein